MDSEDGRSADRLSGSRRVWKRCSHRRNNFRTQPLYRLEVGRAVERLPAKTGLGGDLQTGRWQRYCYPGRCRARTGDFHRGQDPSAASSERGQFYSVRNRERLQRNLLAVEEMDDLKADAQTQMKYRRQGRRPGQTVGATDWVTESYLRQFSQG
jgi:hypothetical protein